TQRALTQAGCALTDVQLYDLDDAHGICAVLALEAMGITPRGSGTTLGSTGAIQPAGSVPLALAGGCKARGDVVGALGVYQLVELTAQLRGTATTQVPGATVAMAVCMAGIANTAVAHVLIGM
ncbi:MAG: thiolase C-terminal domain-containing protein, partial [Roseiflexaceae bacterium]